MDIKQLIGELQTMIKRLHLRERTTKFYRWIVVDNLMKNRYNYIVRKVRNSLLGKEVFVWN